MGETTSLLTAERKSLTFALKAEQDGTFRAVFATFNVIDHDGDVTVPGAFKDGGEVIIGSWGHKPADLPTGKGVIRVTEDEAAVEGAFFLDTAPGRDTYQTVKNLGPLGEWSYLYMPTKYSFGEFEGRQVRFLEEIQVFSVDPVLAGAGINTRTTDIKGMDALTLSELGEAILADVRQYGERLKARAEFRAREGRALSTANVDRLNGIAEALETGAKDLRGLLTEEEPKKGKQLVEEMLRFQRIQSTLLGVA